MTPKNEAATASRLKFRAWHKGDKKIIPVEMLVTYTDADKERLGEDGELFPVDSKTSYFFPSEAIVMQSTGLTDKNGKLIYEGDIITMPSLARPDNKMVSVVIWDRGAWVDKHTGTYIRWNTPDGNPEAFDRKINPELEGSWEVIGNRYENHELLPSNPL